MSPKTTATKRPLAPTLLREKTRACRGSVSCVALALAAGLLAAAPARAQTAYNETVAPGSTHATATDSDAARMNPGALPLLRTWSARVTHVSDLRDPVVPGPGGGPFFDATAASYATPLPLGLALGTSVRWQRVTALDRSVVHVVSADASFGGSIVRNLALAGRLRVSGAGRSRAVVGGDPLVNEFDGAAALDLGVVWRPFPHLGLSLAALTLAGPHSVLISDRTVVAGVGVRPSGTDAFTLGVDGAYTQSGTGWVRAGARVPVPYVGSLRADATVDLFPGVTASNVSWRAGVGLEVQWGGYSLGGSALLGGQGESVAPQGFSVSAGVTGTRHVASLPERSVLVSIPLDESPGPRTMARLLLRLERLRRDPAVRGVFIALRNDIGGLAHAEELREALARWIADGRTVHCHLFEPTGSAYAACASAQRVTLDVAGTVRAAGVRSSRYFLGDALASLGVRTQFVRIGAWKSAAEQFTRNGSTAEARAQEDQLLDDSYAQLRSLWSTGARAAVSSDARAVSLIEGGPYVASQALERGLVDAVESREAAEVQASRACGCNTVPLRSYTSRAADNWGGRPVVAMVHIDGDIISGESRSIPLVGMRFTGDRSLVPTLESLAANDRVRAVVLRIDSGGGDAVASELMWRAVARLALRKPVIASVGRISASGAYYLMAPAREVFTNRSALVGSIGIFFGKADVAGLLSRLGVGIELARRGPRADMDSIYRPFTEDEQLVVSRGIQTFYQRFVERVAIGRHMTPAAVNNVGEGHVFLGARAQQVGLADRTGGFLAAVDRARELGGLPDDAEVVDVTTDASGPLDTILSLLGITAAPIGGPVANEGAVIAQEARELAGESGGLATLLGDDETASALRWVIGVSVASGNGHMLARTEWPVSLVR